MMVSLTSHQSPTCRDAIVERFRSACAGISPTQVARLTGCNKETVRRYLNGQSTPSAEAIAGVCSALGVSADWLLLGRGDPGRTHLLSVMESRPAREALCALASELTRRIDTL
jgi:transcriptional regulator with XRE-family HTH domain